MSLIGANLSNCSLESVSTVPAVSFLGLILIVTKYFEERKWRCLYTEPTKKDVIYI